MGQIKYPTFKEYCMACDKELKHDRRYTYWCGYKCKKNGPKALEDKFEKMYKESKGFIHSVFWPVIALLSVLMVFSYPNTLNASESLNLDVLADAVYISEGKESAKVPYGLIYDDWCVELGACRYYAKEILRIHKNRCRGSDDLIACIGNRYAPPSAHSLNRNWVNNVKYWYKKLS